MKDFTKKDLRSGMLLRTRKQGWLVVAGDFFVGMEEKILFESTEWYDDLTDKFSINWDIMEVREPNKEHFKTLLLEHYASDKIERGLIFMRDTRFYHFGQNNSGGYFIRCEEIGIGANIWIEAHTLEEAEEKFQEIREKYNSTQGDFDSYCECCGTRWDGSWDNVETFAEVMDSGYYSMDAMIHRATGEIKLLEEEKC